MSALSTWDSVCSSIPNFITLARVFLVPVVFWLLISNRLQLAFYLFVLAGVSDAVEGFLAKRFNWQSELGAYLDPLADKLLITCIFISMGWLGELPLWLVIAVVSRDILIVMGVLLAWVLDQPMIIKPLAVSKANTVSQLVLASVALADTAFGLGWGILRGILIASTAVLTFASLGAYLQAWLRHMAGYEGDRPFV